MLTILFFITTIICGIGWLAQYIGTATFAWYLTEKGFPFPSDEEMKKGSRYVVSHMLKDLHSSKR